MADTLSERLRELETACLSEHAIVEGCGWNERAEACREAAAELDRREAIVAAAEACKGLRHSATCPMRHRANIIPCNCGLTALLALLPAAALKG